MFTEEMSQIFRLDLDLRPSSLLIGEDEAPVDFEWTCEVIVIIKERINLKCKTCVK
ncbi:MAG: hypothetical protein ACK52J_03800 [bacterium]|jgi:hypothetical protein